MLRAHPLSSKSHCDSFGCQKPTQMNKKTQKKCQRAVVTGTNVLCTVVEVLVVLVSAQSSGSSHSGCLAWGPGVEVKLRVPA